MSQHVQIALRENPTLVGLLIPHCVKIVKLDSLVLLVRCVKIVKQDSLVLLVGCVKIAKQENLALLVGCVLINLINCQMVMDVTELHAQTVHH